MRSPSQEELYREWKVLVGQVRKPWGTPQERVEKTEVESLIETAWEQNKRYDENQSRERPPRPNQFQRRSSEKGAMINSII